jgi:hypothetical protein
VSVSVPVPVLLVLQALVVVCVWTVTRCLCCPPPSLRCPCWWTRTGWRHRGTVEAALLSAPRGTTDRRRRLRQTTHSQH